MRYPLNSALAVCVLAAGVGSGLSQDDQTRTDASVGRHNEPVDGQIIAKGDLGPRDAQPAGSQLNGLQQLENALWEVLQESGRGQSAQTEGKSNGLYSVENIQDNNAQNGLEELLSAISKVLSWFQAQPTNGEGASQQEGSEIDNNVMQPIQQQIPANQPGEFATLIQAGVQQPQTAMVVVPTPAVQQTSAAIPFGIVSIVGTETFPDSQFVTATPGPDATAAGDYEGYQEHDIAELQTISGIATLIGAYLPLSFIV